MVDEQPPPLTDGQPYEKWRRDIEGWMMVTDVEPRRQAFTVRMKMEGIYRKFALSLDAADLNTDSGMMYLLEKLDFVFRKDKKHQKSPKKLPPSDNQPPLNNHPRPNNQPPQNNHPWPNNHPPRNNHPPPNNYAPHLQEEQAHFDNGVGDRLSAVEKAKQRAQRLSAKLAAEGKYQTPPMSLLPTAVANPVDQFRKESNSKVQLPEVKKLDNIGYLAEFDINDVPARAFLVKVSTRELISSQSGAALVLKGRYMNAEEKKNANINGSNEKSLTLVIQADISAKVLVAIHKVKDVIINYEKQGSTSFNNYGLTGNMQQNSHHFVQRKLFVGSESFHPDFDIKKHLLGEEGANLNFIIRQTGAKVFMRGKGSNYLEQNTGKESFEALHIYVSHPEQAGLDNACQLCESLIDSVKARHHEFEQNQFLQNHQMAYQQQPPRPPPNQPHGPHMQRPVYPAQQYIGNPNIRPNNYPPNAMRPQQWEPQRMPYRQFGPATGHRPPPPHHQHPHQQPPHQQALHRPPMKLGMDMYTRNIEHSQHYDGGSPYSHDNQYDREERHNRNNDSRRSWSRSPVRHRSRSRSPRKSHSPRKSFSPDRSQNRRGRSPRRRGRSRSRSKSPSSSHRRSRSRSRERSSRRHRDSPERKSRESSERKTDSPRSRRFTEEPKKRRKFSEDPKLLEKTKIAEAVLNIEEDEDYIPTPSVLAPQKMKPKVDPFMPPPPVLTGSGGKGKTVTFQKILPPKKESKSQKIDIFKPPEPVVTTKKPAQKALKIGALSTLNAYGDDSDSD